MDRSGSMKGTYMSDAKAAAKTFAEAVLPAGNPENNRVSLVSYSDNISTDLGWSNSLNDVKSAINGLTANGFTNIESGFIAAEALIDTARSGATKVIILLSDGKANRSTNPASAPFPSGHDKHTKAAYLKGQDLQAKATIFTVGLGVSGTSADTLTRAAHPGNYYNAPNSSELQAIYNEISTKLNHSATNGVVIDKIGDNFELVQSSLPTGATYDLNTRQITWLPGTIYEEAQLKYTVVPKENFAGGSAQTNEWANLTYTDINGNTGQTKQFPTPIKTVPAPLTVTLTNVTIDQGQSIDLGIETDASGPNYMSPITGGDGNYDFEWRIVGNSNVISTDKHPTVSPTADTEYKLTVIGSNGCIATAVMLVNVNQFTEFTATKQWDGGTKPIEEVRFQLYRNTQGESKETVGSPVTLSGLTYTWDNLELKNDDGLPYIYSFKETTVPANYTVTYSEDNLTAINTYTSPSDGEFTATKEWAGGTKPIDEVRFQLYRNIDGGNKEAVGGPVALTENSYTWEDLTETDNDGNAYEFSFKETTVPANYTVTYSEDNLTAINTYTSPKIDITGKKLWLDGPEVHPTIELQLYQNDVAYGEAVELTDGTVEYTWTDLDKTDIDGNVYEYRVDEVAVPENYEMSRDGNMLINQYVIPKIDITGKKLWLDGPEVHPTIELQLYQNDVAYGEAVELTDGTVEYTWTDLDKTDIDGNVYDYRVDEVAVPENYEMSRDGNLIINKYVSPKTEYTAYKVWDGGPEFARPEVKFQLYRNIENESKEKVGEAQVLEALTYTWKDLDLTDEKGNEYIYSFEELEVANYETLYDGNTVTNKYVSPKTDITGRKVWLFAPEEKPTIELQLYRDEVAYRDPVELVDGVEEYTWTDLDSTDSDGRSYTYTVKEVEVPEFYDMEISEDGLTITNTYGEVLAATTPETTVTPRTGIENNQTMFVALIVLSGSGLIVLLRKKKYKKLK